MSNGVFFPVLGIACVLLSYQTSYGAEWYVDVGAVASGDGSSWESAFRAIQEGIHASSDGDTVTVAAGTYGESLDFSGKHITVTSTDASDRSIVGSTVITAAREGAVVTFDSGEGKEAVLSGFTITEGGGEKGGGVLCVNGACPTITNCLIYGNRAGRGAGMYCEGASPTIEDCQIYVNHASSAGGGIEMRNSDATITRCKVWGNTAAGEAGILCSESSPTISQCEIFGNETEWSDGGGIGCFEGSRPRITRCRIYGNCARSGGAIMISGYHEETRPVIENCFIYANYSQRWGNIHCEYDAFPIITNCTIYGNASGDSWGGVYCKEESAKTKITNCILWDNGVDLRLCSATYSDVCFGEPGEGNICEPPQFVNPEVGDFHLQLFSPCMDAGTKEGAPGEDIDGELRSLFIEVDMGADELHDEDFDGLPDYWEERFGFDPMDSGDWDPRNGPDGDPDDDEITNLEEYLSGYNPLYPFGATLHVSPDGNDEWDGSRKGWFGGSIGPKRTIQAAVDNAFVGDTVLVGQGRYREQVCLVQKNIRIVASEGPDATEIDAEGRGNGVMLGLLGLGASLEGFTIRNGLSRMGAGIYCWNCLATIRNCLLCDNNAGLRGGGIYCSFGASPRITDCVIRNNETGFWTGTNEGRGGGIGCRHFARPKISGCIIANNRASRHGEGIHSDWSAPRVTNCTLYDSGLYAEGSGGGVTVKNCIVWNGSASGDEVSCTYCCIHWGTSGEGNIDEDPLFVDAEGGDFHLSVDSPCIDAGTLGTGFIPATDMDGEDRVFGVSVDMGADEYTDLDDNGLGDYWEKLYFGSMGQNPDADPDHDGIANRLEARFRMVPTEITTNHVINLTQLRDYGSIGAAVAEAGPGDEIMVSPGTYRENVLLGGKSVLLRSSYPWEAEAVERTVIDGR
ncbi:right-handed parallel beta-helix repeat-containing protein, partial [bacterium]|nr:right-handed parallel beta-helix repeat-containing protein [bacterium]